jgi:hypothetical protein
MCGTRKEKVRESDEMENMVRLACWWSKETLSPARMDGSEATPLGRGSATATSGPVHSLVGVRTSGRSLEEIPLNILHPFSG